MFLVATGRFHGVATGKHFLVSGGQPSGGVLGDKQNTLLVPGNAVTKRGAGGKAAVCATGFQWIEGSQVTACPSPAEGEKTVKIMDCGGSSGVRACTCDSSANRGASRIQEPLGKQTTATKFRKLNLQVSCLLCDAILDSM